MAIVVYGLIDPRTGQLRYIGKSTHLKRRLNVHNRAHGTGHRANWLRELVTAKLQPDVVVLESFESEEAAYQAEIEWIGMAKSWGAKLTNHATGGEGGFTGASVRPEVKEKIRNSLRGHKLSAETRAKIGAANSKALAGKPKTPEHAANISKGKKRQQHGA